MPAAMVTVGRNDALAPGRSPLSASRRGQLRPLLQLQDVGSL
jgi:hypothetical protein